MMMRIPASLSLIILLLSFSFIGCGNRMVQAPTTGKVFFGLASWYGPGFHGRRTASGEVFDMYKKTAAHRTLPFGTRVRVTNLSNGKSVIVRINDRGPAVKGRIIDLSYGAARALGMITQGVVRVKIEVLEFPKKK